MSIQSRRLNNPLLHWVQRHQSMTTLFHSHSHPVHSTQAMQIPKPPDSETVIQAKPVDVQMPMRSDLPIASPRAAVREVTPPLPVDSTPKEAKAPSSTSASKDASAQPDPGWKRLQRIFRKHQEQENPPAEPIKSPEPSQMTNPDIQRIAERPESPKALNSAQQSEKPPTAPVPPVLQRQSNAAETQNASIEYAAQKPESNEQASNTQIPPIDPPAASSPETPKAAIKSVSSPPNSRAVPSDEHPIDFGTQGVDEDSEQQNALPLESVWNVQRMDEPESTEQPIFQPTRAPHEIGRAHV